MSEEYTTELIKNGVLYPISRVGIRCKDKDLFDRLVTVVKEELDK